MLPCKLLNKLLDVESEQAYGDSCNKRKPGEIVADAPQMERGEGI